MGTWSTRPAAAARWGCPILVAAVLFAGCSRSGSESASVGEPPSPGATAAATPAATAAAAPTESQIQAAALLKAMAGHIAGLDRFSLRARLGYEVVQQNGQKIEFGETRLVTLIRPDRLRVEEVASDGERSFVLFDGRQMTVFSADAGVYAQAPQPAPIDDALVYFVRDLRMRMPLALMLSTHVETDLPAMAREVDYVELTDILGKPAHHIAGRTDAIDFQFWIAEGEQPLPLRVVLTYRDVPGQPQFWSEFSEWNMNPRVTDATFRMSLPRDARQIPFAVQVPPAAGGGLEP